ncbi:hypothetical protein EMCRGX_G012201 [Ephydatia muelleri]|eukprot:Em0006g289a
MATSNITSNVSLEQLASDLCIGSNVSSDSLATVKDAFKFFIKADYRCTLELVGVLSGGAIVLCVLALLCACAVCCCIRRRARRGRSILTADGTTESEKQLCIAMQNERESISPNGVNYAGPVYEQPIESSMSLSNPSSDPLPKPAIVNVQTSHYSSCPQGVSSPSVACPPNVAAALPSNQPALHANSFTVNTFTLRKAQTQAQGVQASGAATLFPYSTVNFGDTSSEKVQCHQQPVNYAQVNLNRQGEEMMYEQVH